MESSNKPITRGSLESRLSILREEEEKGRSAMLEIDQQMAELNKKKANLTQTLMNIHGAVTVLEELLSGDSPTNGAPVHEQANNFNSN